MRDVTLDNPRACAIIITASGQIYQFSNLEGFTFSKSENGDAGDFSITAALGLNIGLGVNISPMDYVAVFASRSVTWQGGRKAIGTTEAFSPITLDAKTLNSLTYGAPNAAITEMFGRMDSCVFIGMVDKVKDDQTYEGQAKAGILITGRDLTKIFLENDTFVSYTLPGSDPNNNAIGNLESVVLSNRQTGTQLLLNILNVFCKKDPVSVGAAVNSSAASDQASANNLLAQVAAYGYPWDSFISQQLLDPDFQHISPAAYPPFRVKSGSVWANVLDLRNYPVARLFINELGQLIFDDQLAAWQENPISATIYPSDIRGIEFQQSDENMVTALTILPSIATLGNSQLSALGQVGRSRVPSNAKTITRFGYRWYAFTSLYDSVSDLDPNNPNNVLNRRFAVLWLMKNNFWTCQLTVKGSTKYRVGTRVNLATGGVNSATQFKNWYITELAQNFSYGDDWTTALNLTYPDGQQ